MFSFALSRESLKRTLDLCSKVIPGKAASAHLKCVKVVAKKDKVTFSATDLEASVVVSNEAEIKNSGEILISGDTFSRIVSEVTADLVNVQCDDDQVTVSAGFDEFEIMAQKVDLFPNLEPSDSDSPVVKMDSKQFAAALTRALRVAPDSADTGTRAIGINLHLPSKLKGGTFRCVATTGRNLIVCNTPCESLNGADKFFSNDDRTVMVPNKFSHMMVTACSQFEGEIQIIGYDNRIVYKAGNVEISSLMIQTNFPKYEQIMSPKTDKEARFNIAELASAMRKASIVSNPETMGVNLKFSESGCTVQSAGADKGRGKVIVACEYEAEKDLELILKHDLVTVATKMYDGDEKCLIEMGDPSAPVIWRHKDFIYMLCPISPAKPEVKASK